MDFQLSAVGGQTHTHTTQGKNENTSSDDDIAEIEYLMQIYCKWFGFNVAGRKQSFTFTATGKTCQGSKKSTLHFCFARHTMSNATFPGKKTEGRGKLLVFGQSTLLLWNQEETAFSVYYNKGTW